MVIVVRIVARQFGPGLGTAVGHIAKNCPRSEK